MVKAKNASETKEASTAMADMTAIKAAIYDRIALMKQTQAEIQALENDLRNAQRRAITDQRPFNNRGDKDA